MDIRYNTFEYKLLIDIQMKKVILSLASFLMLMTGCKVKQATTADDIIGKTDVNVTDGRFTPEVMWGMGKMGEAVVSPDGLKIAYTVTYYSVEKNKGNAELYVMDADGANVKQITTSAKSEFNPIWLNDGTIAFARGTENGAQIFTIAVDGKNEKQLSNIDGGIEGFMLSPDQSKVIYTATITKEKPADIEKLYEGLSSATGRINEDLMYRHWDEWVDAIPHIYLADFNNSKIEKGIDILEGEPFECPMRPWGGLEQVAFSPDGKTIAYTCRKKVGKEYALSTNSDIYLYNIADKTVQNISQGIMGYDQNPVFSNNGKYIVWESMEHDGYESDKQRIMLYDLESGERKDLTANLDQTCYSYTWSDDDSKIYFISPFMGTREIFVYNFVDQSFKQVTKDLHDINAYEIKGDKIYAQEVSMSRPAEIFVYDINGEKAQGQQISAINTDVLSKVNMGKVEERWIKTTNGEDMLVWVVYPYNFDSTKTYPALLFCQGGPQDMVSQFWSTRWNFQIMSGAGYFVIAPNRHGVPGFGTKWNEQISGDYGGQNMKDYMQSYDIIAKQHPNIDENRVGACGASYGAFSVYWLAGNHQNRFKAFLAHNGMFNLEQQYCETEEMWFVNWDLGGPYWDKNNPTAQRSYANSPHKFIQNWNTPICVIHGELDYRIVASQGMAAYNAAVLRGVPARYLYFPDENHWVLQPQNSVLWHRNFIDWFDKWLKK